MTFTIFTFQCIFWKEIFWISIRISMHFLFQWLRLTVNQIYFNSLGSSDAYICVSKLTNIGSDNGLAPTRRQATIWTNAGILLIGPWGTNLWNRNWNSYIFIQEMHVNIMSGKLHSFCRGLNLLTDGLSALRRRHWHHIKYIYMYIYVYIYIHPRFPVMSIYMSIYIVTWLWIVNIKNVVNNAW